MVDVGFERGEEDAGLVEDVIVAPLHLSGHEHALHGEDRGAEEVVKAGHALALLPVVEDVPPAAVVVNTEPHVCLVPREEVLGGHEGRFLLWAAFELDARILEVEDAPGHLLRAELVVRPPAVALEPRAFHLHAQRREEEVEPVDAVGRVLSRVVVRVHPDDGLSRLQKFLHLPAGDGGLLDVLALVGAEDGRVVGARGLDHLARMLHGERERPVDEGGDAGFEVGLREEVPPLALVERPEDHAVHPAHHVRVVLHRLAGVLLREVRRDFGTGVPAVADAHAGGLHGPDIRVGRIDGRSPDGGNVAVLAEADDADVEEFDCFADDGHEGLPGELQRCVTSIP